MNRGELASRGRLGIKYFKEGPGRKGIDQIVRKGAGLLP